MTVKTASLHGLGHTDTPTDHTARELPGNKPTQRAVQGQASSPLGRTQPGETDEATAARQAEGTKNAQDRLGGTFAKLWLAQGASNLGDGVQVTALPLLAATLTRDPLPVSAVMFAKWLPWLLFRLLAGALLDRWDRRDVDARMADFARRGGQPAERAARLAAPQRPGRWRVAIALAGLTALAIAAVAFSPAVLAPERPGAAAFAVQPMVGGKVRARLNGSLDGPEVRRELARALTLSQPC